MSNLDAVKKRFAFSKTTEVSIFPSKVGDVSEKVKIMSESLIISIGSEIEIPCCSNNII
jgi:hypothetical protein